MSDREVRVAAVQLAAGANPEMNVERAIDLVERAADQGATYVQLPEYFNYRGTPSRYAEIAETIPGPTTQRLADVAARRGIVLHVGSTFERSSEPHKTYNTSVVLGPTGAILATYRKGHLFDVHVAGEVDYLESRAITPGHQLVVVDLPDFHLGLSVCFDLRFSELYRQLALHGATVFAVPSSFSVPTGRVHWDVLVRARAIESHAYVVAAAQAGTTDEGVSSYGHSMIVGPWGEVLAESSSDAEDIIYASVSEQEVRRRRAQIDVWRLQRPDLYASLDRSE
ncbi:MAG TPA: carbon-nitrogen hydrolase family protein [Acidimicrobiales bacterium]|nr:carbon-nitrogen hydrolase family protein [Acidimicrobiales bacterium]